MIAKSDVGYVADRRQYRSDGRLAPTSGGWMVMWWDEGRKIHVEGGTHRTKVEAEAALSQAWRDRRAASGAAAALGRLGRGASKRRDVDYAALGARGGAAGKGRKKPRV